MKVIVDTDVGVDDANVLSFLLAHKDTEVVAITLVAGNSDMGTITSNCEKILTFLGKESVPLYRGSTHNMLGMYVKGDGYFGKNGLAEIQLPKQEVYARKDMTSVQALIHYTSLYPKQIHAVFIGPITNLAVAYLVDNDFPSRLASITILGTDSAETTIKNVTPHAEFNCWRDTIAYTVLKECFVSGVVPITLIEWQLIIRTLLPYSVIDEINDYLSKNTQHNKHAELFSLMTDKTNKFVAQSLWDEGFLSVDLLAAVGMVCPSVYLRSQKARIVSVDYSTEKLGHVVIEKDPEGPIDMITEIDVDQVVKIVLDTIRYAK